MTIQERNNAIGEAVKAMPLSDRYSAAVKRQSRIQAIADMDAVDDATLHEQTAARFDYNPAIPAPTATMPCVCCGREMARHANITLASGRTFTHRRTANDSCDVTDTTGNAEMSDTEWQEYCTLLAQQGKVRQPHSAV